MEYLPFRRLQKMMTIRPLKTAIADIVLTVKTTTEPNYPAEMQPLVDRYGEGNAWIITKLRQRGIPADSDLELLPYYWLELNAIPFMHQVVVLGGAATVDFVLFHLADGCMAWRIMGGYWHPKEGAKSTSDEAQKRQLIGSEAGGQIIRRVIDLDEEDLISKLRLVCEQAVQGIEWTHY